MELAPAGITCSFEVTFDSPELNVAMSVYDDTGSSPVLVSGPLAMLRVVGNTYRGKFTPILAHSYIIFKAVYTDDTFETLDTDYSQGSESIIAENIGSSSGSGSAGCTIFGFVADDDTILGTVSCS
jgi:hypothetical protein